MFLFVVKLVGAFWVYGVAGFTLWCLFIRHDLKMFRLSYFTGLRAHGFIFPDRVRLKPKMKKKMGPFISELFPAPGEKVVPVSDIMAMLFLVP